MTAPSPLQTDQTGLNMTYIGLALLCGGSILGVLLIILTFFWLKNKRTTTARTRVHPKRKRTKTQVKTLMIVTRQLHSFYKDQEAQGVLINENQREAHKRLQERLSRRKDANEAIVEHKAVMAALQALDNVDSLTNVGEALASDIEWRTKASDKEKIMENKNEFDLEEIGDEQDQEIDAMRETGVFNNAIDLKKPVRLRRESTLKIMHALNAETWSEFMDASAEESSNEIT